MALSTARSPRVAIVGSGFSGLCLGIQLKRAGIQSFTIFEKEASLGGTWRDNTYPGACCDIPSIFYCFSFEQKVDWPQKWSPQASIREYMDHCGEKYQLLPHMRFGTAVEAAAFDNDAGIWRIRTSNGEEIEAEILVSGVGQLHQPLFPKIPGLDSFGGTQFHSSRWRHDVDLEGKRVAVIGSAASAIQFIPQIARQAANVLVFQRSPNWMIPRGNRDYSEREKRLFENFPLLTRLYRSYLWLRGEILLYPMIRGNRLLTRMTRRAALENMHSHIQDEGLRRALTPDYPLLAKRVLISDDYYPTLARENVELITEGIQKVNAEGVVTSNGQFHGADVLVLATGFDTTHFLTPMKIEGMGGRSLEAEWKRGAEAYLGLAVPEFPNFFMMYGPNTNLGHNSIIFMIEAQARYIVQCIEKIRRNGLHSLNLRPDVMRAYNEKVQSDLADTAWAKVDRSWYKDDAGRITNNWPHSTFSYWWRTRRVDWSAYRLREQA